MNQDTIDALEAINRDFYRRRAREFSATRRDPWPGWELVLESFRRHGQDLSDRHRDPIVDSPAPFDVLDAGCGNGRFAALLCFGGREALRYVGVDASPELVAEARRTREARRGFEALWVVGDLCGSRGRSWPLARSRQGIRCVVAFGLFHHVAARQRRLELLSNLGSILAPGGLLAVSFWQFGDRERFRKRIVGWGRYNRQAEKPIDVGELEPGDLLLAWGDARAGEGPLRYCHHAGPQQARALVEATDLEEVETFRSDGRSGDLNLYFVLRRPSSI